MEGTRAHIHMAKVLLRLRFAAQTPAEIFALLVSNSGSQRGTKHEAERRLGIRCSCLRRGRLSFWTAWPSSHRRHVYIRDNGLIDVVM